VIGFAELNELIGRWWYSYDEGRFDAMTALLTEDVHFSVRTDTGKTDYEEFVNADIRGRDEVMAWQVEHRLDSPYPLRHCGINMHRTGTDGDDTTYASYIFVTQIVDGQVSNLSTAPVSGAVRLEDGELRIASLHVVLDTASSTPLRGQRDGGSSG